MMATTTVMLTYSPEIRLPITSCQTIRLTSVYEGAFVLLLVGM